MFGNSAMQPFRRTQLDPGSGEFLHKQVLSVIVHQLLFAMLHLTITEQENLSEK